MGDVIKSEEKVIKDDDKVKITEISELVELRSKLKKISGKNEVNLRVKLKDLPEGTRPEDLIAAIEVNTRVEEEKSQKKQKDEEEKKKPKFKLKYLIPIPLVLLLLLGVAKSCGRYQNEIPVPPSPPDIEYVETMKPETPGNEFLESIEPETKTLIEDLSFDYYNADNPYVYLESLTNAAGQEGMTANAHEGYVWVGDNYDCNQQFEDEKASSEGQQNFTQIAQQIDEQMEILLDANASQADKCDAARNLLEINQGLSSIFKENIELAERKTAEFKSSSEAYADSNTASEIAVIEETLALYKECADLCEENIATMQQILALDRDGYEIDISGQNNSRGDYKIMGEAKKEVVITPGEIKEVTGDVPAANQLDAENELINAQEKTIEEDLIKDENSQDR